MQIDWSLMYERMVGEDDPFLLNHEEVADAVFKAYKRYAERDFRDGTVEGIEQYFKFERDGYESSGIIDLWGWTATGNLFITDWKTTGSFTDSWMFRESNSEQSLQYVHGLFSTGVVAPSWPVEVRVRGVNRGGQFKALPVREITAEDLARFDIEQDQWNGMYTEARKVGFDVPWPKNMPDGCTQFGYERLCPFYGTQCGSRLPGTDSKIKEPRLSHSFMKNFKRCPEYARLLTIGRQFGTLEEESEELLWGLAFHRGIAEVYRQMKEGE